MKKRKDQKTTKRSRGRHEKRDRPYENMWKYRKLERIIRENIISRKRRGTVGKLQEKPNGLKKQRKDAIGDTKSQPDLMRTCGNQSKP